MSGVTTRFALATAGAIVAAALAGCSSGSPGPGPSGATPSASQAYSQRYVEAPPMLVQCGLDRATVRPGSDQPWFTRVGKILPFTGPGAGQHAAEFNTWWSAHNNTIIAGQDLLSWQSWAAQHDQLPSQVCGSSVTAAGLHAQIFPGQQDPWTT